MVDRRSISLQIVLGIAAVIIAAVVAVIFFSGPPPPPPPPPDFDVSGGGGLASSAATSSIVWRDKMSGMSCEADIDKIYALLGKDNCVLAACPTSGCPGGVCDAATMNECDKLTKADNPKGGNKKWGAISAMWLQIPHTGHDWFKLERKKVDGASKKYALTWYECIGHKLGDECVELSEGKKTELCQGLAGPIRTRFAGSITNVDPVPVYRIGVWKTSGGLTCPDSP